MHKHQEKVILPYKKEQLFSLVLDVEKYPEFLPWCSGAKILYKQDENLFFADLEISFQSLKHKYTSRVEHNLAGGTIDVSQLRGPFRHLVNKWSFKDTDDGVEVEFLIEIQLKSKILDKVFSLFFQTAYTKMLSSFMTRAKELFS